STQEDSPGDLQETNRNCDPLPCNRVVMVEGHSRTGRNKVCKNKQELAFLEGWLVHCIHKLRDTQEGLPIKATRQQILEIIEGRDGLVLVNEQFERLKKRFISRDGKPAIRVELLRQVKTG